MRVVDASVWMGRLVPQDVHYASSRHWLEVYTARGGLLVAPILLLAEVAGAIARRLGSVELAERATQVLLQVPGLRLVPLDAQMGQASAQLAAEFGLRGADATYVAVAHHLGVPLVTWDRQQGERAAERVSVLTPDTDRMSDLGVLHETRDSTYSVR
jgi:predicted nucleic acid-binding protein